MKKGINRNKTPEDIELQKESPEISTKNPENKFLYRLAFENIITSLSTNFIKISTVEIDRAINDALQIIGEFAGFDRSYIFLFNKELTKMENTHEWCAEGIEPQIEKLKGLDTDKFPWWIKKMKQFETIYIPSVADLPPEAGSEQEEFQLENIQSLIAVPMVYEKHLIGFLGFDAVHSKRAYDEDIITLLKITGEIFANALKRREIERALQDSETKLNTILDSIWDYVWMVDKDLNIVWANYTARERFKHDIIGKKCYFVCCHKNNNNKHPHCLASKVFRNGNMREYVIKCPIKGKDVQFIHCKANVALKDENGNPLSVVIIGRDITEQKDIEFELLKARNDLEKKIKERTADLISTNKKLAQEILARQRIENELRSNEERFRSQYKMMPMPTYTWRKEKDDFLLIDYNDASHNVTKGKIENYLGIKAKELYHDRPDIINDFKRCFREKSSFSKEIYYNFKSISRDGYFTTTFGFISPDMVIVHTEDITERKHTEEELKIKEKGIASSINAFMITDLNGNITYINTSFLKMWGYKNDNEVIGKPFMTFLKIKDDISEILKKLHKYESLTGEFIGVKKNRSLFDVYLSANLIYDDKGKPVCIMAFFINITKRKDTERKLSETLTKLAKSRDDMISILNLLSIGTAITDRFGHIIFLSKSAQEITGISQDDAFGKLWVDIFPISRHEKAQLKNMAEISPESREKMQVHIGSQGDKQFWVDIEIKNDPRNPDVKILFFHNVTEIFNLKRMLDEKAQFHDLIGRTKPMMTIYQQIREISKVDWTVLIEGETGTGKELVARAIHFSSNRKEKPFIPVNCAGLTDSLLASQLFGHKKGAFTGAVQDHKGFFEAANGGTIFLDEIGDISINVQTNLLRVLEEKEIMRLGESSTRKIDIRVIAATNQDLLQKVDEGNFRPDLLYRIRVTRIKIPPLRTRREDIPLLVNAFISQSCATTRKSVKGINDEALNMLLEYSWPGNVRELRSAIEFAVTHCKESFIQPKDIPPEIYETAYTKSNHKYPQKINKEQLMLAIKKTGENRTRAAEFLGISRSTFYRRLKEFDIESVRNK